SNNHCLDKGEKGLVSTLNFWRENYPEIPVYGAYLNEEDMNDIRTLEVNGITFAFLGYMEHTNMLSLPKDSECRLTYLSDEERMERQIKRASEIADCVIVSVHFGIEVTNTVSEQQYYFAQKFADWGADIIIGTQPHTIQTMEYLDTADGGRAFVFYCLGNFISAMDNPYSMVEMLGRITVTKDNATGEITLSGAEAVPLINHYDSGYRNVRVYPFSDYTAELAAAHGCAGTSMEFFKRVIEENIPEEYRAER
ncbi:MAG: CapA family protein, partial [Oscillospiraceae bacterium]